MNASSGDSPTHILEGLEPGTSLANAIGEQMFIINSPETMQPISSMLSHTDSERQSLTELENLKYKTELCRNFSMYGFCSYSSRCQFAHGLEELRCRTRHPKYKTELCRNFLSGFCKYGSRCQFLHSANDTKDSIPSTDLSAAIGTYLLTNMLAQSAVFGLEGPITHQSALAALAACANFPPRSTPMESSLRRTTNPFNCGIEMQQVSPLHFSPHTFHGISIPQNQNNNNNSFSQSQSSTTPMLDISTEEIPFTKRIRKFSAHI